MEPVFPPLCDEPQPCLASLQDWLEVLRRCSGPWKGSGPHWEDTGYWVPGVCRVVSCVPGQRCQNKYRVGEEAKLGCLQELHLSDGRGTFFPL